MSTFELAHAITVLFEKLAPEWLQTLFVSVMVGVVGSAEGYYLFILIGPTFILLFGYIFPSWFNAHDEIPTRRKTVALCSIFIAIAAIYLLLLMGCKGPNTLLGLLADFLFSVPIHVVARSPFLFGVPYSLLLGFGLYFAKSTLEDDRWVVAFQLLFFFIVVAICSIIATTVVPVVVMVTACK